ncbi:transposase [Pseudanabaena sp. SR411]|uniref:transposase n=1 Tax=Pseudanabaena sp. SR411 TaxID=1980935 RepID=UPI0015955D1D|nr:transposase [Pseudanabaena sp. SR411]
MLLIPIQYLSARPIATYDSEYGSAAFMNLTEDIPSDLLLRLRPNRCLYKSPAGYSGCGRPRKHGDKFQLANAASWGEAQSTSTLEDETIGQVQIQQWSNLHFKKSAQRHFQVILVTHHWWSGFLLFG